MPSLTKMVSCGEKRPVHNGQLMNKRHVQDIITALDVAYTDASLPATKRSYRAAEKAFLKYEREAFKLTKKQLEFLIWIIEAGCEQNDKFLHHDGWEDGLTKARIHKSYKFNRDCRKAVNLLLKLKIF